MQASENEHTVYLKILTALERDLQDGRRVRHGDHLPPHKYIRNTSTRGTTPTEHLLNAGRRPQTSQKCTRRGDSEHRLNELQRWARATAISEDPRDGQETLRLLLPPPRSLCASTGHCPHHPSQEPVQPTTARVP